MEHMSWWQLCFSDLSCLWNQFLLLTQVQPWGCCIWEGRVSYLLPSLLSGTLFSPLHLGEWVLGMLVLEAERREFLNSLLLILSPPCFYGVVGKLLPWLQPTCKQKRWLWCCNNPRRGDGLNSKRSRKHLFCFLLGLLPSWIHGNFPWLSTGHCQVSDRVTTFFQDVTFSIHYRANL